MTTTTTRAGEYLVPSSARPAVCRSCGASIAWTKTASGHAVPLDLSTVEVRSGARWALTHFAVCPHSRDWRSRSASAQCSVLSFELAHSDSPQAQWDAANQLKTENSKLKTWLEWRERSRLADGTLPLAWWTPFRRDLRSGPVVAQSDID